MVATSYADRLFEAMRDRGVSPATLAKELGVSLQAIRKLEAGTSKALSAYRNDQAAEFLDVSPSWLARDVGPKGPYRARAEIVEVTRVAKPDAASSLRAALDLVHQLHPEQKSEVAQVFSLFATSGADLYAERLSELLTGTAELRKKKPRGGAR